MAEAEILEPFELSFSDLLLSSRFQSSSPKDRKRYQWISRNVMEALGPTGPGLLCITDVLGCAILRRKLLPMARKLALLDPDKRNRILKEHHLGSDVPLKNPERDVSAFAMQLNYERTSLSSQGKLWYDEANYGIGAKLDFQEDDDEFKNLGDAFKELGFCMRDLGLLIARVSDREIGGGLLEESLLESCTAKGRLIHYHSNTDKCALREAERRNQSGKRVSSKRRDQNASEQEMNSRNGTGLNGSHFNLWQQWHYELWHLYCSHGSYVFVIVFLPGMHFDEQPLLSADLSSQQEQVPHGQDSTRQFYSSNWRICGYFVQREATVHLHCVCKPEKLEHISRETFEVFLQPKWNQTFSVSEYTMEHLQRQLPGTDELPKTDIHKIVPPLSSRLRDGMTFAEFSRETTKQYYGGSGMQSNRS